MSSAPNRGVGPYGPSKALGEELQLICVQKARSSGGFLFDKEQLAWLAQRNLLRCSAFLLLPKEISQPDLRGKSISNHTYHPVGLCYDEVPSNRSNMMDLLFGFQIVPGSDDLLGYCTSMEEAVTEAVAHRRELIRDQAQDEADAGVLAPISVYEVRLRPFTLDLLLPVLNKRQELHEAFVEEIVLVGAVE